MSPSTAACRFSKYKKEIFELYFSLFFLTHQNRMLLFISPKAEFNPFQIRFPKICLLILSQACKTERYVFSKIRSLIGSTFCSSWVSVFARQKSFAHAEDVYKTIQYIHYQNHDWSSVLDSQYKFKMLLLPSLYIVYAITLT